MLSKLFVRNVPSVSFTYNCTLHLTKITIKFVKQFFKKLKLKNIDSFNKMKRKDKMGLEKII
jgi:hypothetical protein